MTTRGDFTGCNLWIGDARLNIALIGVGATGGRPPLEHLENSRDSLHKQREQFGRIVVSFQPIHRFNQLIDALFR